VIRWRRIAAGCGVVLLLAAISPAATADDLDDDLADVRARIAALGDQIDAAGASRSSVLADVEAAAARMDGLVASIDALRDDLASVRARLAAQEQSLREARIRLSAQYQVLAETRSELDAAREDARAWAAEVYMSAGNGAPSVVFSAAAWQDVVLGIGYLETITARGDAAVDRFEVLAGVEERIGRQAEADEAALVDNVSALEATKTEMESLHADLDAKRREAEAELQRQQALLASVDGEIANMEGELAALEKEEDSVRALIAARATTGGRAPGKLYRPVPGPIGSGFGPRFHPILGYVRMHNGVDMACATGDPIHAAGAGTVILAGVKGGYGNAVMIDHGGGMVTLYGHQSALAVSEGDRVDAGQVIGSCGSTGLSTEPHLHFEVRIGGVPKNPAGYL
jgi:murein DD-endopeptidase MepM/ murein hydrolase activator NlpD